MSQQVTLTVNRKGTIRIANQNEDPIFGVEATIEKDQARKLDHISVTVLPAPMQSGQRLILYVSDGNRTREYVVYNHELKEIGRFSEHEVRKAAATRGRKFVDISAGGRNSVWTITKDKEPYGGVDAEVLIQAHGGALDGATYTFIAPHNMHDDDVMVIYRQSNHDSSIEIYNCNMELIRECKVWEIRLELELAGRPHLDLRFSRLENAEPATLEQYQLPVTCVPCEFISWGAWRGTNDDWNISVVTTESVRQGDYIAVRSWRIAGAPYGFDEITIYLFDGEQFIEYSNLRVEDLQKQTEASRLVESGGAEVMLEQLNKELAKLQQELKAKRRELQGQPGWKLTQLENEYADPMTELRQKIYSLKDALNS